jgi:hypothetical protein
MVVLLWILRRGGDRGRCCCRPLFANIVVVVSADVWTRWLCLPSCRAALETLGFPEECFQIYVVNISEGLLMRADLFLQRDVGSRS